MLYVSTHGNDGWSGRLADADATGTDGPLATLEHAQATLRRMKAAGQTPAGATVLVRGGIYRLSKPMSFGLEDSGSAEAPIVWRAYEKEKVTLTGAVPVTGFRPWKGKIVVADLKGTPLEKVAFRQLFFGGQRQVLARYPNVDPKDPHFGTWAYVLSVDGPNVKDHFTATSDVIKDWQKVQQAEVAIHPAYGWAWNIVPIKSVDRESGVITLAGNVSYDLMVGDRYFVQGLLSELDAPGEWYLDRDEAKLYFWPPADIKTAEVSAPVAGSLVVADGASHVTLRGFTLEACGGDAVTLKGCERCLVAGCTIRNTGMWAVSITGGHNTGASGNDIYATGAGGVSIDAGDRKTLARGDCFADNNYIHHIAAFQRTYNTGVNLFGVGNRASHNLIHDCYHQAILMGGNDNVAEYNVIHHTNLGSEDTGGLYMSSRDFTQRGNIIRYNVFHHIGGFGKDSSWQPVQNGRVGYHYPGFTWGVYLDAPEVGCTVFGNVLYSVPVCGLFNHEGRDNIWENNIIIDAPAFQCSSGNYPDLDEQSYSYIRTLREKGGYDTYLQHYPELATYTDDAASHHTCVPGKFVRNIIYYTRDGGKMMRDRNHSAWDGGQLVWTFTSNKLAFTGFQFDYNCIYGPPGLPLRFSLTARPDAGKLLSWEGWLKTDQDAHSVSADPLFVDPAKHDYRLRPDSPALKLGFKPIPLEQIGPYRDELRASWPVVEAPGVSALGDFTTERYFQLPGQEPVKATAVQTRGGLGNVVAKLKEGRPVMVVCFAGGTHQQGGWFGEFVAQLKQKYPQAQITGVNAGIDGGFRGSGASVFRFGHEALRHKPDLVIVDFAADDQEGDSEAAKASVEGMVRQTWQADPRTDVLFVYAFRAGYETDYAKGVCPSAVSAHERVAERYGVPSINFGYAMAKMAREGKLTIRATAEEAKMSPDKPVFTNDGVYTTAAGWGLCAKLAADGFATAAEGAAPGPHEIAKPLMSANMEGAVEMPITADMLTGDWQRVAPPALGGGDFGQHFDALWATKQPGAKMSFKFTGTRAWIFDVFGPATGRVKVTVDGQDKGIREQLDRWCYYYRLGGLEIAAGLVPGEHTVVLELLADAPDRSVPIAEARRLSTYQPADFEGVALHLGAICVVK
jgi:hypothetical protein